MCEVVTSRIKVLKVYCRVTVELQVTVFCQWTFGEFTGVTDKKGRNSGV